MSASYLPSANELSDAVALIVTEENSKDLDVKQVRTLLLQRHSNWRVPERRVHKFLKRQRNSLGGRDNKFGVLKHLLVPFVGTKRPESPDPRDAATAATAISSVDQSPQRVELAGSGLEHDMTLEVPETVTTNQDDVTLSPLADVDNLPVIPEVERKNAEIFEDDNDGKKPSLLSPCEGCFIL